MNPFQIFSLAPSLDLNTEDLRETYQKLAARNHPDKGGEQTHFENINKAYQELKSPASRLKAFMLVTGVEHNPRGSVSDDFMDLFMQVGDLLQQTDAFLRKKSQASSTLAKALLESESMETQEKLSKLITVIESQQESITNRFSRNLTSDCLPQLARDLSFLEKWQAQLQQRYGSLF